MTITNNILAFSTSFFGDNYEIVNYGGSPVLRNNCVYNPSGRNYSGLSAGTSDIQVDPLFVNQSGGDYHLTASSPCVNAGWNAAPNLPSTDLDGNPRIYGASVDIGAYELGPKIIHVNLNSPGSSFDGTSWATAFHTVQAGLNAATSGNEVWVAKGTYVENITLTTGVGLYGGFTGTETARAQRNSTINITILDGNKSGPVVTCPSGATQTTVIDGFTVQNGSGNANDSYGWTSSGGGIYCNSSSPTITHNTISNNTISTTEGGAGGGIFCSGSSPVISYNTVSGNYIYGSRGGTFSYGGGIYCTSTSPVITYNTITGNGADAGFNGEGFGGGVYCSSTQATISNNIISSNTVSAEQNGYGGGIYCSSSSSVISNNSISQNYVSSYTGQGGGIYCGNSCVISNNAVSNNGVSAPYASGGGIYSGNSCLLSDNTISGNSVNCNYGAGGGICCGASSIINNILSNNSISGAPGYGYGIWCNSATIISNTISGNIGYHTNYLNGGGIYSTGSSTIADTIIAFNSSGIFNGSGSPVLRNNCIYNPSGYNYSGITSGSADIQVDPLFVNQSGGDYHLTSSSPCINAGWNGAAGLPSTDLDGKPRILNGIVDMGAYEFGIPGIRDIKISSDGSSVNITAVIVSAAFPDYFYIEADNRACGIRVQKSAHGLTAGMRADVVGTMATTSDSERYISATTAVQDGNGSVKPIGMNNRSLGGISILNGQVGVKSAWGVNNIGLLVSTWGKVTSTGTGYLYIDDGSAINDGMGSGTGVKVICDPTGHSVGDFMIVTGISSCFKNSSGDIQRQIVMK